MLITMRMCDTPPEVRAELRDRSLGPIDWGSWSWTFQSGDCWVTIDHDDSGIRAWAMLTKEMDVLPVVGCYTRKDCRGQGLSRRAVAQMLKYAVDKKILHNGDPFFAMIDWYAPYEAIAADAGLRAAQWC